MGYRDEQRKYPEGFSRERLHFLSLTEGRAAAREVWRQPWPLSDKQLQKKHPFRWGIELLNCKNRRKALCWGQQRGENTIPLLKGHKRWRNVSIFLICCCGGSMMVHMRNLARLFPQYYVLSNWVKTCWFCLQAQPSTGLMNADDCDCSSVERSSRNTGERLVLEQKTSFAGKLVASNFWGCTHRCLFKSVFTAALFKPPTRSHE